MKTALFILIVFFVNLCCVPGTYIYQSINWGHHNPLFTADGKMCVTGPRHLKVELQSTVYFICPNTATVLQKSSVGIQPANMYENLWLLYDKTAFDRCDASLDPNRKLLLSCITPVALKYSTVQFNRYTAEPDGLTFEAGQSYYFIATSDGTESNLNSTHGGHCNDTVNKIYMKLEVYVCHSNMTSTDPNCADDVGVISCPAPNCPDGSDCTQPTSALTATPDPNDTGNWNTSRPEKQARTEDNDKELKMWKYVAIGTSALAFVCFIAMVVVLACVYFNRGKRSNDVASQEIFLRAESVPCTL